jgi:hypothetical protein
LKRLKNLHKEMAMGAFMEKGAACQFEVVQGRSNIVGRPERLDGATRIYRAKQGEMTHVCFLGRKGQFAAPAEGKEGFQIVRLKERKALQCRRSLRVAQIVKKHFGGNVS